MWQPESEKHDCHSELYMNSTSKWSVSCCWLHNSICITLTRLCPWPVALPPPQPSALLLLALYPTSYQAAWIKEGLTSNHSQKNSQNSATFETNFSFIQAQQSLGLFSFHAGGAENDFLQSMPSWCGFWWSTWTFQLPSRLRALNEAQT